MGKEEEEVKGAERGGGRDRMLQREADGAIARYTQKKATRPC